MSVKSGWKTSQEARSGRTDPLQGYYGRPLTSGLPSHKYIGRVIVELWEPPSGVNDANGLTFRFSAAGGIKPADVLKRVAAALPQRLAKQTVL